MFLLNKIKALRSILFSLFFAVMVTATYGATINGKLLDDNGFPLGGANVILVGTNMGSTTNMDGEFKVINVKDGEYQISASLLGYETVEKQVAVSGGENVNLIIETQYDPVALKEVTVLVEKNSSHISASTPMRVEVISNSELRATSVDGGVLSAMSKRTGLNTRPCALCGSAGIGMQGMDGSYTEIRIDGLPVISGLGGLYGLDGLPVSDISKVELTKGTGSGNTGSGAMAGGVNFVTTGAGPIASVDGNISASSTMRHSITTAISYPIVGIPSRLSINYASEPNKVDQNDDKLTDTPEYSRLNLTLNMTPIQNRGKLTLRGRLYGENRFAGDTDWEDGDQGSASVYGRDIQTNRRELSSKYDFEPNQFGQFGFEAAYVNHKQDSWYGTTEFNAEQTISMWRASLQKDWNSQNITSLRGEYRYEKYDDNLQLSSSTDKLFQIPGAILQHSWSPNVQVKSQLGLRSEYYDDDGFIFMPRGSFMYRPSTSWTFRLNGGAGFRPVTLFSLDKAVHAGFENVIVPAYLKNEKSVGGSFSINWIKNSIGRILTVDLTGFYTSFTNKVILAFTENVGETEYSNAEDAYSQGIEIQASYIHDVRWQFDVGGTISQVQYKNESGWNKIHMQNLYTVQGSILRQLVNSNINIELTGNLYGPQILPEGRSKDESPVYGIVDLGVSKKFENLTLSFSVKNITDYTQPDDPFVFDTILKKRKMDSAMIYGPLLGRLYQVSLSFKTR